MNRYLLIFCILILPMSISAESIDFSKQQWELKKDSKKIKVFIAEVLDSDFRSAYGRMIINASLHSLVALIMDTDACNKWAYLCKQSHIHKRISDTDFYLYTATNPPWPVKNRDLLVHVTIEQQKEDLAVVIKSVATTGIYPEQKNNIRITEATAIWVFTPLSKTQTQVESYSHVNPAGSIPAWLDNMLLTKTPYISLKNMRKIIESGKYDDYHLPYIQELPN